MIKRNQFRRTYKCKIKRIEENDAIFTIQMFFEIEVFIDLVASHHGNGIKIGGGLAD
jgi:hypothetical protein